VSGIISQRDLNMMSQHWPPNNTF